jgi:hypothetical protein
MDFSDLVGKFGSRPFGLERSSDPFQNLLDRRSSENIIGGSIGAGFGGYQPTQKEMGDIYNFAASIGEASDPRGLSQRAAQAWSTSPQAQLSYITPEQYAIAAQIGNPIFDQNTGTFSGRYDVGEGLKESYTNLFNKQMERFGA